VSTPGIIRILGPGGQPAPIAAEEIRAVRATVESGFAADPRPYIGVGERVRIAQGALAGVAGILLAVKGLYRLVISVELLQRSVAVEIERDWVEPDISLPYTRSFHRESRAS
jgi:transcription antitermination factor NusG